MEFNRPEAPVVETIRTEASEYDRLATDFLQWAANNQEICRQIWIAVPVRPGGHLDTDLARFLSVWTLAGIGWCDTSHMSGGFIDSVRCGMAWNFTQNNSGNGPDHRYLIMIDDDMVPDASDIWLPYLLARHQQPIVGGCALTLTNQGFSLCFSRKDVEGNWRFPLMDNGAKIPAKGLVEVGHCGTGVMCIRRDVLEAFSYKKDDGQDSHPFLVPTEYKKGSAFKDGSPGRGEDIEFCAQVRRKGYKIYVDLEAHIGHRKTAVLRWQQGLIDESLDPSQWVLPAEGTRISND